MKIVFWNKKGGVGKTSLAYNVARDLGYFLQSNDDSIIEIAYEGKAKITSNIKVLDNCVYDLGGFVDNQANKVIESADLIVIPTVYDLNALRRTLSTIKDVYHINKNAKVVIVANNLESKTKQEDLAKITDTFKDYKVLEMPHSRIFQNAIKQGSSVNEITESKINAYRYRNALKAYKKLLTYIKKA